MKKWLYFPSLGLIFATILSSYTAAQAANRIAVVNITNIFQQIPQRATVAKQLENEFQDRADELRSIENNLQTKVQRLQREGSRMKPSERSSLETSVIKQRETLSEKEQEFEQENRRRQTEERNKILHLIQEAVKNTAIKEGYDVVIDANAIAYANNIKDITADVLKQVK